ncbi:MAG: exo-alpha-sialidase [Planctomycetota bacterium]
MQFIFTFRCLTVFAFAWFSVALHADDSNWKLQALRYNHPGLIVDLGVGLWAYPLPIDYDQDGDLDLLVGCPDKPSRGTYFFENPTQDATNKFPVFKPGVRIGNGFHSMLLSRVGDQPRVLTPGKEFRLDPASGRFDFDKPQKIPAPSKPAGAVNGRVRANMWRYVDFDGDGDHDLAIGIGDWADFGWDHAHDRHGNWRNGPLHGHVYIAINDGTDLQPSFRSDAARLRAGGGDVDVYGWPSPNFADFDSDGDLDLLCGEFMDGFTYFQNVGTRTDPDYAAGVRLTDAAGEPIAMHVQMITPSAIDWDRDGDIDLIVGDEDGRVAIVENTGRLAGAIPQFMPPVYFRQQADTLKFGALATPFVDDWDGDGDQDIVCGNTAGNIGWFENLGDGQGGMPKWDAPKLLEVATARGDTKPFRIMAGARGSIQGPCEAKWGYTTLSVADWDKDGDRDIVYNSILGRIGLLINDSGLLTEQRFDTGLREWPPTWAWSQRPTSDSITQWRTTPLVLDLDGDDSLDLVMLDQQGYLTLRRSGGAAERVFIAPDGNPLRLNAGTCGRSGRTKLAIVDWDGDGRLDLLVNSENAAWYRNLGDRDGRVVLKKVGNLARRNVAGHTSSPAIADFDRDGKPDLLVGSENGRIYHIAHDDCVSFTDDQTHAVEDLKPVAPRFPGWVDEGFLFEKASFPSCHASTVCETTRGLVAAWFGGTKEGDPDVGIWTSYHDGPGWSSPRRVADGVQHASLRYPCWNPVLYQPPGDGPTLLFFKVGPNPRQWWGEMMVSYDRGRTFRDRRRLPEGIDGPVRCKPILLADGRTLLCGSSTEHDGWRVHFESATLSGGVPTGDWKRIGPINDASVFNAIQPTLMKRADGELRVLCRTRENVIATSVSNDSGLTWSKLTATDLPNPNSGIETVTLAGGSSLLVYNPLAAGESGWGKRSTLSLAYSPDGQAWETLCDLEHQADGEFSYPAMIQSSSGRVHITYTYNRTRIKHVVVDPKKLAANAGSKR